MKIEYEGLAVASATIHTAASTITKIHGFKVAANDRFLQLHDTKGTPTTATILRVWPIYGTAPFGEGFIGDPVTCVEGVTFAVSSEANTYTASAETVDLFVNGESSWDNTGVSTAGDYTTGVEDATIWADVAGGHELLRLEFTALTDAGATLYAKLFPTNAPDTGDQPLAQMELPANTSKDFFFHRNVSGTYAGVFGEACYVVIEAAAGNFVAPYGGSDFAIKGTYK